MRRASILIFAVLASLFIDSISAAETPQQETVVVTDALLIPADSVIIRNGIPGVMVLDNGMSRFRMIKTGKKEGNKIEILSGLLPGDAVIKGDLTALRDGTQINIQKP